MSVTITLTMTSMLQSCILDSMNFFFIFFISALEAKSDVSLNSQKLTLGSRRKLLHIQKVTSLS